MVVVIQTNLPSLGGVKSSTAIRAGLHNLFDVVSSAESSAGDTEYRCFYIHNAHATLTMQNSVIWIQSTLLLQILALRLD